MTFNKICLLKGNFSYFNRKIFFYESYLDYVAKASDYQLKTDINFNPNDGISTTLIVTASDIDYFDYAYVLVLAADNTIVSRWYVMEAVRNLSGQFTLTLRRDIVAESISNSTFYMDAPIYVERGVLQEGNHLMVLDEGLNLNQIKKGETLLQDEYKTWWVVGYFDNNWTPVSITIPSGTAPTPKSKTIAEVATATGIPLATLTSMLSGVEAPFAIGDLSFIYGLCNKLNIPLAYWKIVQKITSDIDAVYSAERTPVWSWTEYILRATLYANDVIAITDSIEDYLYNSSESDIRTALNTVISNQIPGEVYLSQSQLESLRAILNEYDIIDGGNYYKVDIVINETYIHPEVVITKGETTLFDGFITAGQTALPEAEEGSVWKIYLQYNAQKVVLRKTLDPVATPGITFTPSASHNVLKDAPYSMFAIPYSVYVRIRTGGDNERIEVTKASRNLTLNIASAIATAMGDSLYDLQILPYAPKIARSNTIWGIGTDPILDTYTGYTENVDFQLLKDSGNNLQSVILYEKVSTLSISIQTQLDMKRSSSKMESQTDFYRLCSPNYSGLFEFNLARNGGSVSSFLVDCTYKPINPFIRVTPNFAFLYGQNFKDGRGLICGGDFSLAVIKNQWIQYEQNNKTFSQLFSREIENLEFRQSQEVFKEPFSVISGMAVGAGAGALAGAKMGGVYGAAAGAALGGTAGLAGGLIDIDLNQKRRAEEKDFVYDRYRLNLAAIKAMPQSLAKNSVLTAIHKIYPFVEYYTCTDEEIAYLERYFKYNGMRVGAVSTIKEFANTVESLGIDRDEFKFFKGKLIHADGILEDDHYISVLYDELSKGVYL